MGGERTETVLQMRGACKPAVEPQPLPPTPVRSPIRSYSKYGVCGIPILLLLSNKDAEGREEGYFVPLEQASQWPITGHSLMPLLADYHTNRDPILTPAQYPAPRPWCSCSTRKNRLTRQATSALRSRQPTRNQSGPQSRKRCLKRHSHQPGQAQMYRRVYTAWVCYLLSLIIIDSSISSHRPLTSRGLRLKPACESPRGLPRRPHLCASPPTALYRTAREKRAFHRNLNASGVGCGTSVCGLLSELLSPYVVHLPFSGFCP